MIARSARSALSCEHSVAQVRADYRCAVSGNSAVIEEDRLVLRRQSRLERMGIQDQPTTRSASAATSPAYSRSAWVSASFGRNNGALKSATAQRLEQRVELVLAAGQAALQAQEAVQSIEKLAERFVSQCSTALTN